MTCDAKIDQSVSGYLLKAFRCYLQLLNHVTVTCALAISTLDSCSKPIKLLLFCKFLCLPTMCNTLEIKLLLGTRTHADVFIPLHFFLNDCACLFILYYIFKCFVRQLSGFNFFFLPKQTNESIQHQTSQSEHK